MITMVLVKDYPGLTRAQVKAQAKRLEKKDPDSYEAACAPSKRPTGGSH